MNCGSMNWLKQRIILKYTEVLNRLWSVIPGVRCKTGDRGF